MEIKIDSENGNKLFDLSQRFGYNASQLINLIIKNSLSDYQCVYIRRGQKWTKTEENELRENFKKTEKLHELAKFHLRTPGSIMGRLCKLGYYRYDAVQHRHIRIR